MGDDSTHPSAQQPATPAAEAARLHEEAQRHSDRGEYAEARALFERALALRRSALGDDHPMTLVARAQLMGMRSDDEGQMATLPEMEQLHAALLRQVAPDHPLANALQQTSTMLEHVEALAQQQQPSAPEEPPGVAVLSGVDGVAREVLAGLDDVPWRALRHAYGPATDVPGLLRALLAPDKHTRERAMHDLYGTIWHQGTVYEASAFAVPFLLKLLVYPGTPDLAAVLGLLEGLASGDMYVEGDSLSTSAAHDAVGIGLPLYLDLLDAAQSQDLRGAAIATLAAFPERSAESAPRLQAALAAENDPLVRLWLMWTLGKVMDASERAQTYFDDVLARTDDPGLAFLAAAALADRAGEATPQWAVEALVDAVGAAGDSVSDGNHRDLSGLDEAIESLGTLEWPGVVEFALERLAKLGKRVEPTLLRAFRQTRDADAARTAAEMLLDFSFNDGQIQAKSMAISRPPDGRWKVEYHGPARQPERSPATLTDGQRAALEALAAHDPFWEHDHDLLALYGLPPTREGLGGYLARK